LPRKSAESENTKHALKEAFFRILEDERDLRVIERYRERAASGEVKYYTLDEIEDELGLNDEA